MWTTDILREEHRWILCMLHCLERVVEDSERKGRLDARCTPELLALFTHFADGLHQEREERCLFPRLLGRARNVTERTDIGLLCGAHEVERHVLGRLSHELLGGLYGDRDSLREFQREARRYLELQRAHVAHENRELLPLTEHLLSSEDDLFVLAGFNQLERNGPGEVRGIFQRIQALCTHMGVTPMPEPPAQIPPSL